MTSGARSVRALAPFAALAFVFLIGLGVWQLRRMEWKEALIARVEQRVHVAPVSLPSRDLWPSLKSEDYDFTHVVALGSFDFSREALVYALAPADAGPEPGYLVLTPFRLDSGGTVLVNRGFVGQSKAGDPALRRAPLGSVTHTGLMRAPQARNPFTPADSSAKGVWYTRDPEKIGAALRLADAAPFTLDQDPGEIKLLSAPDGLLRVAVTTVDMPNNHLSYAVTWFGLAGALAIMFAVYSRGWAAKSGT
jgi:surfeit locus 1 family protein